VSAQFVNSSFIRKLEEGRTKEAQDQGTAFIRQKMRQAAFCREILPPVVISEDEIDRDVNTDLPQKIIEKEPDSVATFVTFKGTGDRTWFSGPRYKVIFGKVESQRFVKSKFELMTYQNDIRQILSDNSVKDMADVEDGKFIETAAAAIYNKTGQDISLSGNLDQDKIAAALKKHVERKVPVGKILITKSLAYDLLKLQATNVGNDVASRHYDQGIEEEAKLWGIPMITTIKTDILPNNQFYIFAPQNYLGNFFLLQDATLFIKQEADVVEFWSYSAPGMGFGNINGITRVTLT
jgi:hypothetical protein